MGCLWRELIGTRALPSGSKPCVHLVFIQCWAPSDSCSVFFMKWIWTLTRCQWTAGHDTKRFLKRGTNGQCPNVFTSEAAMARSPMTVPTRAWLQDRVEAPLDPEPSRQPETLDLMASCKKPPKRVFNTCLMYLCVSWVNLFKMASQSEATCGHHPVLTKPNSVQNFLHSFAFCAVFVNNFYKSYFVKVFF